MRGGSHKTKRDRAIGRAGGDMQRRRGGEGGGERKLSSQTCKKTDESDFQF